MRSVPEIGSIFNKTFKKQTLYENYDFLSDAAAGHIIVSNSKIALNIQAVGNCTRSLYAFAMGFVAVDVFFKSD
jgi:hypothetical protein